MLGLKEQAKTAYSFISMFLVLLTKMTAINLLMFKIFCFIEGKELDESKHFRGMIFFLYARDIFVSYS